MFFLHPLLPLFGNCGESHFDPAVCLAPACCARDRIGEGSIRLAENPAGNFETLAPSFAPAIGIAVTVKQKSIPRPAPTHSSSRPADVGFTIPTTL